ncbi:MAG: hypothetical protein CVV46_11485 [Spirochaetae bacterium HGW-Spirochaetae-2]|jgi:hypothetical protein|nr:MAG: hypothetical protein CVV46_11485 [Spirochaetae bacterium HGW-Spirochaetae-2]
MSETKQFDVVVVGSGPAGIGAAFASARAGVNTLLVEKNSVLGGQMTSGLVTGFHGMRVHEGFISKGVGSILMDDRHTSVVVKGLALEIMNRLADKQAAYTVKDDPPMRIEYDPEALIPVLFEMADEYGLHLMLNSFVFGLEKKGDKISFLKVANKSGEVHIKANVFIDASADGDLIEWAGEEFEKGDALSHRCMPLSIYQVIGNVDLQKTLDYFRAHPQDLHISTVDRWQQMYDKGAPIALMGLRDLVQKAVQNGDYPIPLGTSTSVPYPIFDIQTSFLPKGFVKLLVDMAYGIDITNADELSKAEIDMRKNQVPGIFSFMKKYVPGFENAYMLYTSNLIGTRESRRLKGIYTIVKDDVLENRKFDDVVARSGRAMNVHSSGGGDLNQERGGQQWIEAPIPIGFDIPYRALLPKTVKNLITSGRCISVDRDALGSIRGEPVCMAIGEAAGVAGALSTILQVGCKDVPIKELQLQLKKYNVVL